MPTPDASAFTQQQRFKGGHSQMSPDRKIYTHLYHPFVRASRQVDFLPSFTNKFVSPTTRIAPPALSALRSVAYIAPKYIR